MDVTVTFQNVTLYCFPNNYYFPKGGIGNNDVQIENGAVQVLCNITELRLVFRLIQLQAQFQFSKFAGLKSVNSAKVESTLS